MQGAATANASGVRSHALCRQVTEGDMWVLCHPVWLTASCIASSQRSTQDKAIQVIDTSIYCMLAGCWWAIGSGEFLVISGRGNLYHLSAWLKR